jgi:hypothetical protein
MLYCPFPATPCAGDLPHSIYNGEVSPDMAEFLAVVDWSLYASTLILIWQRLVSLNISWDFDVLGKVIRKRGMFTLVVRSAGDRWLIDICLTQITSKPINMLGLSSSVRVTHVTRY